MARFQFALKDLILATLLVAAICGFAVSAWQDLRAVVNPATILFACVLFAVFCFFAIRPRSEKTILIVVLSLMFLGCTILCWCLLISGRPHGSGRVYYPRFQQNLAAIGVAPFAHLDKNTTPIY